MVQAIETAMVEDPGKATRATKTDLRSFPPFIAVVKSAHALQRHDLCRG